jgi:hypothetical protein
MIDLREYFPDFGQLVYNKSDGNVTARFTLQRSLPGAPTGIDSLYNGYMNLGKPGVPYMWRKEYWRNGAWCTKTYAVLFMGDDCSVTEAGDWYSDGPCTPSVALGYKTAAGAISGLYWSGPGGLSEVPALVEIDVWRQNTPGGAYGNSGVKTFGRTGLIERLDTFTPKFGRDIDGVWREGGSKEYEDVAHIVMYHGTRHPNETPVRCVAPMTANGPYYQSFKDYNSYAIELWLAKGIGIVQHNTPFIEKGWDTIPNCAGDIFSGNPGSWVSYIDQQ